MRVRKALKFTKLMNQLNEWHQANSRMYNVLASKIIEQWITEAYAKVENKISLKGFRSVPSSLRNPQKKYDYFLLYVVGCMQSNLPEDTFVKVDYTVKNHKIPFVFALQNNCDRPEGDTEGKVGEVGAIFIKLPLAWFNKIYKKIKNGSLNYSLAEEFISSVKMALAHELTHSVQFINNRIITYDNTSLPNIEKTKADDVAYLLYFTKENEIEATMSQAYTVYKQQGTGIIGRNKDIKKSFFRCLINVVLERWTNLNGIRKRFNTGTLSFPQVLTKVNTVQRLILTWSIFVYGLKYSTFDELLRQDDNISYEEVIDTDLIEENVKHIRAAFKVFTIYPELQQRWTEEIESYSPQKRAKMFAKLFSITKDNENFIASIYSWILRKLGGLQ